MPKRSKGNYLRGNVYWYAVQENNRRVFKSLKTSDESETIRRAATAKREHVTEATVVKNTFAEYADAYPVRLANIYIRLISLRRRPLFLSRQRGF